MKNVTDGPVGAMAAENLVGCEHRLVVGCALNGQLAARLPKAPDDVPDYVLLQGAPKGNGITMHPFTTARNHRVEVTADTSPGDELALDPDPKRAGKLIPFRCLPPVPEPLATLLIAKAEESARLDNDELLPLVRPLRATFAKSRMLTDDVEQGKGKK